MTTFHPIASMFPLIEGAEFDALVEDIRVNGLNEPIVIFDGMILDGRNRDRACVVADVDPRYRQFQSDDPAAFVLSANLYRRHVSIEARRKLAAERLKANPAVSNNALAKLVGLSDKTIGDVRAELERRSEIPNVSTRADTKGRAQPATKRTKKDENVKEDENVATTTSDPEPKPKPADGYSAETWLAKPIAERKRIIAGWGTSVLAGMSAAEIYALVPNRTHADLQQLAAHRIVSELTKIAGSRRQAAANEAGRSLTLVQRILQEGGKELPEVLLPSALSKTVTAALRVALSKAATSPNEAVAALTGINNLLGSAVLDIHDIAIAETTAFDPAAMENVA
jgi:hypothetical protein